MPEPLKGLSTVFLNGLAQPSYGLWPGSLEIGSLVLHWRIRTERIEAASESFGFRERRALLVLEGTVEVDDPVVYAHR